MSNSLMILFYNGQKQFIFFVWHWNRLGIAGLSKHIKLPKRLSSCYD